MIFWVRVYAAVMLLASLAAVGLALLLSIEDELQAPSIGLAIGSAACAVLFGTALWMPAEPWAWTLGLVVIALGMMGITILVCIPMLIAWQKPTVKAAFSRL